MYCTGSSRHVDFSRAPHHDHGEKGEQTTEAISARDEWVLDLLGLRVLRLSEFRVVARACAAVVTGIMPTNQEPLTWPVVLCPRATVRSTVVASVSVTVGRVRF